MKTYSQFIIEANIPQSSDTNTTQTPEIKFVNFNQIQEKQYIRLYHKGELVGNFRIEDRYNTNPRIRGIDTILVQLINDDGSFDISKGHFMISNMDSTYTFQLLDKKYSAGIVFVYNGKILLVKNKNGNGYTHPKGNIKEGETYEDAACRELLEETGINFPKELLKGKPIHTIQSFSDTYFKTNYYYIIHLNKDSFNRFIGYDIIPKEHLQIKEVTWGGFVSFEKCKELFQKGYDVILKYVN